jgi:hypothetical protein
MFNFPGWTKKPTSFPRRAQQYVVVFGDYVRPDGHQPARLDDEYPDYETAKLQSPLPSNQCKCIHNNSGDAACRRACQTDGRKKQHANMTRPII